MRKLVLCSSHASDISDNIFDAWEQALDTAGIAEEEIHLLDYNSIASFEKILERKLDGQGVDLSFTSLVLPEEGNGLAIQGLKVGGNRGGIANSLIRGVIRSAWEPIGPDEDPIEAIDEANIVYIQDRYGYCYPTSAERAASLVSQGNHTQHSGYGSQQYMDITNVHVYRDYFGNIKLNRSTLRYD